MYHYNITQRIIYYTLYFRIFDDTILRRIDAHWKKLSETFINLIRLFYSLDLGTGDQTPTKQVNEASLNNKLRFDPLTDIPLNYKNFHNDAYLNHSVIIKNEVSLWDTLRESILLLVEIQYWNHLKLWLSTFIQIQNVWIRLVFPTKVLIVLIMCYYK